MLINRKTFFKLLMLVGLSTTLMVLINMLFPLGFADLSAVRTRFLEQRSSNGVPFDGKSSSPWPAAIDHSNCPLDKHFKVYLYNHYHPQTFRQFSSIGHQPLLGGLESRLKQKQAWATNPKEACAFLVVLRPFLQISPHAQSLRQQENDITKFLSSLPYWKNHGSSGRNHIIIDLLESTQVEEEPLPGSISVGDAIIVSNYRTRADGILAPPLPMEVPQVKQTSKSQIVMSDTYANIERIFATVNNSREYSSILPLHRRYLFYFEGSYVESITHDKLEANSQISMISKQAFSITENNYIEYASKCVASNVPGWNGEWRLCDSSEKNRLLRCKDSKFSLILGPLGPENNAGPTTYQRLIESLKCGSIPVVIGLSKLPFDDVIDWQKAALTFPWSLWRNALQVAAAMNDDIIMEFRKHGKFLLHTYFHDPGLVFDSIVAIVRKMFLHPPPMVWDFNATLLKRSGTVAARITKDNIPFTMTSYQYRNYALNMGDGIWNVPPGPHFVYPVSPFKPASFHNQLEARQLPLPNSIQALKKVVDEQLIQKIPTMDRFSVLKKFGDLSGKINGTRFFQRSVSMKTFKKHSLSGFKSLSKQKSMSPGGAIRYIYSKITDMYTVVTLTHHRDEQIAKLIKSLEYCQFLHKIVIVWNNEYPIPAKMNLPYTYIPIEVVNTGRNSLNNRFLPMSNIETEAILTLDDDIGLTCDDIELGFRIWRENQESIVGWTSRVHGKDRGGNWAYSVARVCERSMVITNAAFFHKYYSYLYSYWMPAGIREIVDQLMNCEDIAMNFLVSHLTGKALVKIGKKRSIQMANNCKEDLQSGLSCESSNHFLERDFCLNAFAEYYGYVPLVYSVARTEPLYAKSTSKTDWCDKYRDDRYSS